jgi:hypothetical protein
MNAEKIMFLNATLITRCYRTSMDTVRLSVSAQRAEDAKMGRKLVERAEAQLAQSHSLEKGRRVVAKPDFSKGQHVNIRT